MSHFTAQAGSGVPPVRPLTYLPLTLVLLGEGKLLTKLEKGLLYFSFSLGQRDLFQVELLPFPLVIRRLAKGTG